MIARPLSLSVVLALTLGGCAAAAPASPTANHATAGGEEPTARNALFVDDETAIAQREDELSDDTGFCPARCEAAASICEAAAHICRIVDEQHLATEAGRCDRARASCSHANDRVSSCACPASASENAPVAL